MRLATIALGALLLLFSSCSDEDNRYDDLMADGWSAYSSGNYQPAAACFMDATLEDASRAGAWNGLGWSQIGLFEDEEGDDNYLQGIDQNFQTAVTRSDSWAPPLAGLALTRSRLGESLAAVHFAGLALEEAGDDWVYSRNADVTGRSLRQVRAWNYFLLEDYAAAQAEVELVLDVVLDPDAEDYLAQLLIYIEQM